jgi:hypothetical protein
MSELTKKAIEAGIIPRQAIQLLKLWQSLPDDLPEETLQAKTEEQVRKILAELEELIDKERVLPEMRETDLSLAREYMEKRTPCSVQVTKQLSFSAHAASIAGHIVFAVEDIHPRYAQYVTEPGNVIKFPEEDESYVLEDSEPRYRDSKIEYYVCRVRRL